MNTKETLTTMNTHYTVLWFGPNGHNGSLRGNHATEEAARRYAEQWLAEVNAEDPTDDYSYTIVPETVTPTGRFRLWFAGEATYYGSLLPTLERRKVILATGADPYHVTVEERHGDGWMSFDAERFLDQLAVMFAPAE